MIFIRKAYYAFKCFDKKCCIKSCFKQMYILDFLKSKVSYAMLYIKWDGEVWIEKYGVIYG